MHRAIAAFGWNILMIDGVEADDVIGTLALQAKQGGGRCIISTGDKDLAQIVTRSATILDAKADAAGALVKAGQT